MDLKANVISPHQAWSVITVHTVNAPQGEGFFPLSLCSAFVGCSSNKYGTPLFSFCFYLFLRQFYVVQAGFKFVWWPDGDRELLILLLPQRLGGIAGF